ncbi:hypothetical protein [Fulvivirga ligni]|uniref:hypothetical protein n=1 Tax=Fulvivirga ligni TaxID=2904246 RepID=UPI001F1F3F59|nr:hypothetical protein [Fulvivirga ligni]UII22219.1 hypothetical protein LVD16_03110 [Fulvivirga ligni]
MNEQLRDSIEDLYRVFQKYEARDMSGSPLYADLHKWNRELLSKPLRELDENDLSRFTGKCITTWGSIADYKHFLPRIFELIALFRAPYEISIAFDKLHIADWNNWARDEQKVVQSFMFNLWESILNDNSEKAEREFESYFCAITNIYPDFSELLYIWNKSDSKSGIKHLASIIVDKHTNIFERKGGFLAGKNSSKEFIRWVLSDIIYNKIQAKYFEYEKDEVAEKISWAEQILTAERRKM